MRPVRSRQNGVTLKIFRRAAEERLYGNGSEAVEALVAAVVLVVGLAGMLGVLVAATHATATSRLRQAGTSLAREVTEDVRTLGYDQILQSTLASKLQPLVPNATVSGTALLVNRSAYTFKVQFTECSLHDPSDGYGSHSSCTTTPRRRAT